MVRNVIIFWKEDEAPFMLHKRLVNMGRERPDENNGTLFRERVDFTPVRRSLFGEKDVELVDRDVRIDVRIETLKACSDFALPGAIGDRDQITKRTGLSVLFHQPHQADQVVIRMPFVMRPMPVGSMRTVRWGSIVWVVVHLSCVPFCPCRYFLRTLQLINSSHSLLITATQCHPFVHLRLLRQVLFWGSAFAST